MSAGPVIALLENEPGPLMPALEGRGARVELVHGESATRRPAWDLVVLRSRSAAALGLAAAADARGVPVVNCPHATRRVEERVEAMGILEAAGLPVPASRLVWLDGKAEPNDRRVVLKAARGSRGVSVWHVRAGGLPRLAARLEPGPYLVMDHVAHAGRDLKVLVAGDWVSAVERPFPALTPEEKRGKPVTPPAQAVDVARAAGQHLGLTCFGCDFVCCRTGWKLVDVHAFPDYSGLPEGVDALARAIMRAARG